MKYTQEELKLLVDELRAYPAETQWLEFKSNSRDPERIGRYISGLANVACYCRRECGYMVWGIDDATHEIRGTDFNPETQKVGNQLLRMWLKTMLMPEIAFDFHEVVFDELRVVLLEVESAYRHCRLLMRDDKLTIDDVVLLDYVQKGKTITKEAATQLRKRKLVGGRYPKLYPALSVAKRVNRVEDYLDAKAFDDDFYMQKVLEFICAKGNATRVEIEGLLKKHLSSILTEDQKHRKIANLLSVKMSTRLGWIKMD